MIVIWYCLRIKGAGVPVVATVYTELNREVVWEFAVASQFSTVYRVELSDFVCRELV